MGLGVKASGILRAGTAGIRLAGIPSVIPGDASKLEDDGTPSTVPAVDGLPPSSSPISIDVGRQISCCCSSPSIISLFLLLTESGNWSVSK